MTIAPILPAFLSRDRDGRPVQQHVWCNWCQVVHNHGVETTHAGAHCYTEDSPYKLPGPGYTLAPAGEVTNPEAARPDRILTGPRSPLSRYLQTVAPVLRNAILQPILGRGLERRFGTARVATRVGLYWIDPDAFPSKDPGQARSQARPIRYYTDLASFLAALYGLALGAVAVRLLEAATGITLDAHAKLAIAAEVEASQARQAEGRR